VVNIICSFPLASAINPPFAIRGVVRVGLVQNTSAHVHVSSVTALARFALDGVARKVAIHEPSQETQVDIGSPVTFVSTQAEGVPKFGVTKVGLVENTGDPVHV
jgi:hypothetical protein